MAKLVLVDVPNGIDIKDVEKAHLEAEATGEMELPQECVELDEEDNDTPTLEPSDAHDEDRVTSMTYIRCIDDIEKDKDDKNLITNNLLIRMPIYHGTTSYRSNLVEQEYILPICNSYLKGEISFKIHDKKKDKSIETKKQKYLIAYINESLVETGEPIEKLQDRLEEYAERGENYIALLRAKKKESILHQFETDKKLTYKQALTLALENTPKQDFMDGNITRIAIGGMDNSLENYQIMMWNVFFQSKPIRQKMLDKWISRIIRGIKNADIPETYYEYFDISRTSRHPYDVYFHHTANNIECSTLQ